MGVTDTCSLSSNTCTVTVAAADLQALTDGTTYTITVNVDDAAENSATPDTGDTFVYDITAPSISNVVPSWGAYLNAAEDNADGTIAITTSGAADGQTVTVTGMDVTDTCSLTANTCTVTVAAADLQALTNGNTYTITVNVDDVAENSATPDTGDTFVYDITAPSISDVVPSWGTFLNAVEDNSDGTIVVTTADSANGATVTVTGMGVTDTCTVSSNACTVTVAAADLQSLTDGTTYTINVALTADAAGNTATSDTGDTFVYDITAPSISDVVPSWGAYLNAAEDNADGTITITTSGAANGQTVTVTGMGVTDTCSLTTNTCTVTVAAADLQALTDGTTYTITVNVDDVAENSATPDTGDTFVYDITAPSIANVVPEFVDAELPAASSTFTLIV
jgi:invasion protein IalB